MNAASCIYEGELRHRRSIPLVHAFHYRLYMMYVDLDELAKVFAGRWLWSVSKPNLAWFRRGDHCGPAEQSLAESIRELVAERTGCRPAGPIRLLTQFRHAGFSMNPISLYYCFDAAERLEHVVAEVNNTPWGEQHCYVLPADRGTAAGDEQVWCVPKQFHVSPFFGMDFDYVFRLTVPGECLAVSVESHPRGGQDSRATSAAAFSATLRLQRRPLDGPEMARVLCRYPLINVQVWLRIYWQALRLWGKRVPLVPHPRHAGRRRIGPPAPPRSCALGDDDIPVRRPAARVSP